MKLYYNWIRIVSFCLMISLLMSSCVRENRIKGEISHAHDKDLKGDSCPIACHLVKEKTLESDTSNANITTWGVNSNGSLYGDKDNTTGLPSISGLYVAKRWSYCKNDSCNSCYYVMGLRCPNNLVVKRWVSKQILKEMKANGNKEVKRLYVEKSSVSKKQIVDSYLNSWKRHYDHYINHFLICENDKAPTEQFGLFITDVWHHRLLYTMCVYSWYDMASCGCPFSTSYYTINALSGKTLTINDVVHKKDKRKIEALLGKKLLIQMNQRTNSKIQGTSFLDKKDGIALIKEGLLIYFHPYTIGYGYEGQYNVVITYDELQDNSIKLKTR